MSFSSLFVSWRLFSWCLWFLACIFECLHHLSVEQLGTLVLLLNNFSVRCLAFLGRFVLLGAWGCYTLGKSSLRLRCRVELEHSLLVLERIQFLAKGLGCCFCSGDN